MPFTGNGYTYTIRRPMSVVKSYSLAVIFAICSGLAAYLFRAKLGRVLTTEDYGLFYYFTAFFTFISFANDLGFSQTLPKIIPSYQHINPKETKGVVIVSLGLFTIVTSISSLVIYKYLDYIFDDFTTPLHHRVLILFILSNACITFLMYLKSIFLGFKKIKSAYIWDVLRYTVPFLLILFVSLEKTVTLIEITECFTWGNIICLVFALLALGRLLFKTLSHSDYIIKNTATYFKDIFKISFFTFFIVIFAAAIASLDSLILKHQSTLFQVGVYNYAIPVIMILWLLSSQIFPVVLPYISEYYIKKSPTELNAYLKEVFFYVNLIMVPAILSTIILRNELLLILFGQKALLADASLTVLSIGALFYTNGFLLIYCLVGLGLQRAATYALFVSVCVSVCANFFFDSEYGALGASIANTLAQITTTLTCSIVLFKYRGIFLFSRRLINCLMLIGLVFLPGLFFSFFQDYLILRLICCLLGILGSLVILYRVNVFAFWLQRKPH